MNVALPDGSAWKFLALVLLLGSLVCLGAGMKLAHASPEHPRHDTITYSLNSDDHAAMWISYDRSLDAWTSQYFPKPAPERKPMPNFTGGSSRVIFAAPAPVLDLAAPAVEIKSDEKSGNIHKLHLVLRSPRGAGVVHVRLPEDSKTSNVAIGGRDVPFSEPRKGLWLDFSGVGQHEIDLYLTVESSSPLSFWVMDESVGLPASSHPGRPDDFMAWYGSDVTLVGRKITP